MAQPPDPLVEARAAMDRGEYERAAVLLREVVGALSSNLEAHYRLGVTASHLTLIDEANQEFEWVVAHAPADSPEVQIAREWLSAARGPAPSEPATPTSPEHASLSGVATDGQGTPQPVVRRRISLKGMKEPVLETAFDVRTDQEGRFQFPDVPPGEYMLTDTLAGQPTWRLRLTLKKGERLTLNLTPENSTGTRDDFPERR